MAEDKSVPSNYLNDVLTLLGAGGAAKGVGAAATKGMFFTPAQFARVLKQSPTQNMHPAVFNNLDPQLKARIEDPTSKLAQQYQNKLDQFIIGNPHLAEKEKNVPELFGKTAWSHSPTMGLVREVPDTGSRLKFDEDEITLNHPSVNLHSLFGTKAYSEPSLGAGGGEFDPDLNHFYLGDKPSVYAGLHEFTHAGQNDAGKLYPPRMYHLLNDSYLHPNNWSVQDLKALQTHPYHEGSSSDKIWKELSDAHKLNNFDDLDMFRQQLSYMKQAPEIEAFNVENRFKNPQLYLQDPESTQYYRNDQAFQPITQLPLPFKD